MKSATKTWRIALLTPEFPTEIETGGGLSSYLGRLSLTLVRLGHGVEVFTISQYPSGSLDYEGTLVHRVRTPAPTVLERSLALPRFFWQRLSVARMLAMRREAIALAAALEERHRKNPFDLVQSSDYRLSGMCVSDRSERVHVVRCSSAGRTFEQLQGEESSLDTVWINWSESRWLRNAAHVYAPSHFVADYQRRRLDRGVAVIRPPFFLEAPARRTFCSRLPSRYLLHFGNINRRKGSDLVAKALEMAWREAPGLRMVWAGKLPWGEEFAETYPALAEKQDHVLWLGALKKPELYSVLKNAVAVVAPSRGDNLPNNVLESLACGTPVIGSNGASIDELVVPGVNGELVPLEDSTALAQAMLRAWRSAPPFDGRRLPPLADDLEPNRAAANLLEYANLAGRPSSIRSQS